eukprot:9321869-Ditylum_brightwellii.AAC.1
MKKASKISPLPSICERSRLTPVIEKKTRDEEKTSSPIIPEGGSKNAQKKKQAKENNISSDENELQQQNKTLVEISRKGDLAGLQRVIEYYTLDEKPDAYNVLNQAHVWTEIEDDWGTFHSFNWYEDTPLIASVRAGH